MEMPLCLTREAKLGIGWLFWNNNNEMEEEQKKKKKDKEKEEEEEEEKEEEKGGEEKGGSGRGSISGTVVDGFKLNTSLGNYWIQTITTEDLGPIDPDVNWITLRAGQYYLPAEAT